MNQVFYCLLIKKGRVRSFALVTGEDGLSRADVASKANEAYGTTHAYRGFGSPQKAADYGRLWVKRS